MRNEEKQQLVESNFKSQQRLPKPSRCDKKLDLEFYVTLSLARWKLIFLPMFPSTAYRSERDTK